MGRKNGCPVLVYNKALERWEECGKPVKHYAPVLMDGRQCCEHAEGMRKAGVRVIPIEQYRTEQARKRSKKYR